MNAIIGMTDLVLATELTPAQREYLTLVRQSSDQLHYVSKPIRAADLFQKIAEVLARLRPGEADA